MQIIGFAGKAGSGKDTAYEQLREVLERQGLKCTKLSFAGKLKDICTMMFGWDRDRLEWDLAYKEGDTLDDGNPDPACQLLGKTRRVVMQELGTEAMRKGLHQDIWIIAMKLAIMNGEYDEFDVGFITDCRFMNEIEFVRSMGGVLFKIVRTGDDLGTKETQHQSELEWQLYDEWNSIIPNVIEPELTVEQNLKKLQSRVFEAYLVADLNIVNRLSQQAFDNNHLVNLTGLSPDFAMNTIEELTNRKTTQ